MGVGETGKIIGKTGVGETEVGEMGVIPTTYVYCTASGLKLNINEEINKIILHKTLHLFS